MVAPPHCRLCGERHWSGDGHKYPKDLRVRPLVSELAGKVIEGRMRVVEEPVAALPATKVAERPVERDETLDFGETFVACGRKGCNKPVPVKETGRPGKYCSGTCRKIAYREKTDA